MPWNPEVYNQFKNIRYKPFFDLMELVKDGGWQQAVDIGCGTGEQTAILAERFTTASFVGIDSSDEMLVGSNQREHERLQFRRESIEEFVAADTSWDLIFSNAALQWADNHEKLFPGLIAKLSAHGQLAVQMPCQRENVLNQLMLQLVAEKPFTDLLNGFRRESPLLSIDEYATLLFDNGLRDLTVMIKVYPIIAGSEMDLYNFISGSALIPYMEKLNREGQELLRTEFIRRIGLRFRRFPAIYSFKRILLHGTRG